MNRRPLVSELFEASVFWKLNQRFLEANLVSKAIGEARCDRAKERMGAHLMHEDQVAE